MRKTRLLRSLAPLPAAALMGLAPLAAQAGPGDLYYERALMSAANQRCNLFSPDLGAALDSAAAQARGAALRGGASNQAVAQIGQNARWRAAQVACDSKDLAVAAGRVRSAFASYAQLQSMTFPGDVAVWRAQRSIATRTMTWRLSQSANFGRDSLIFGLAGLSQSSGLIVAAHFADGAQPYAARLILRDVRAAPEPFIGGLAQGGRSGLAARMPMRAATAAFIAEARADADPSLLPPGALTGTAFRFPRAAADAMDQLDPREAVSIEFLIEGSGGDTVRTAYIEVGDFAAGRAFLAAAQR